MQHVVFDFINQDPEFLQTYASDIVVMGLKTNQPIVQVGPFTFIGTWDELVGTELIFEQTQDGQLVQLAKTRTRLMLEMVKVKPCSD